jgi:hypothetical protein
MNLKLYILCGEIDIWQMVVPNWIMQNELVVSLSPIISHSLVTVDDEGIDSEHFQSSSWCEASLTSTWEE